jgi:hypothetical protein
MNKELVFVYDWIGPEGPLNNYKVPDVYDLMKRMPYTGWDSNSATDEHDPIAMKIKEIVNCRFVPSYDIERLGDVPFMYEILLSPKKFFTEITLNNHLGVFQTTPVSQKVLDAIRKKNGFILLSNNYESFVDAATFESIHNYFKENQIPLNKVIYLSNCANAQEIYEKYCRKYGIQERINCEYIGLYVLDQRVLCRDPIFSERTDKPSKKEKLFLNFNRRHRLHRYILLLKFFEHDLLKRTHMSFSKDVPVEHWIHDAQKAVAEYDVRLKTDELYKVYDSLPYVLDTHDFSRFPMEDRLEDTISWYDKTYISIVSETNFENNIIHMTEKTIKPIIFKQPFITVGPAKTLAALKKLGFRTFSDFWDESYDNEPDPKKRIKMIVSVCRTIAKWNPVELHTLYAKTKEIREHNFKNLANLQPIELNSFVEKYGANI